jgi:hypothetical protein
MKTIVKLSSEWDTTNLNGNKNTNYTLRNWFGVKKTISAVAITAALTIWSAKAEPPSSVSSSLSSRATTDQMDTKMNPFDAKFVPKIGDKNLPIIDMKIYGKKEELISYGTWKGKNGYRVVAQMEKYMDTIDRYSEKITKAKENIKNWVGNENDISMAGLWKSLADIFELELKNDIMALSSRWRNDGITYKVGVETANKLKKIGVNVLLENIDPNMKENLARFKEKEAPVIIRQAGISPTIGGNKEESVKSASIGPAAIIAPKTESLTIPPVPVNTMSVESTNKLSNEELVRALGITGLALGGIVLFITILNKRKRVLRKQIEQSRSEESMTKMIMTTTPNIDWEPHTNEEITAEIAPIQVEIADNIAELNIVNSQLENLGNKLRKAGVSDALIYQITSGGELDTQALDVFINVLDYAIKDGESISEGDREELLALRELLPEYEEKWAMLLDTPTIETTGKANFSWDDILHTSIIWTLERHRDFFYNAKNIQELYDLIAQSLEKVPQDIEKLKEVQIFLSGHPKEQSELKEYRRKILEKESEAETA